MFFFPENDSVTRELDTATIINLLTSKDSPNLSVSSAVLNGRHASGHSTKSDRAYYIVDGRPTFTVAGQQIEATAGDVVFVPRLTTHAIYGAAKYVVINSPAFDPSAEVAD